jgi:DNA-binding phage protein
VAGLQLFLSDGNNGHQSEAVHYLVTAIAEEKSPEVQQAILDAFAQAKQFSQEAKDSALRTALDLNRTLTEAMVRDIHLNRTNSEKALFATFVPKQAANWTDDYSWRKDLTFLQKLRLYSISAKSLFYDPTLNEASVPENTITLEKYVTLINLLLAAGAKSTDNNWVLI